MGFGLHHFGRLVLVADREDAVFERDRLYERRLLDPGEGSVTRERQRARARERAARGA